LIFQDEDVKDEEIRMRQSRRVDNSDIKLTLAVLSVLLLGLACTPAGCVRGLFNPVSDSKVFIISPEDREEFLEGQMVHFEAELSGFTAVETSWTSSIDGNIPSVSGSTSTDAVLSPGTHTITFLGAYEGLDPEPEPGVPETDPLVPVSNSITITIVSGDQLHDETGDDNEELEATTSPDYPMVGPECDEEEKYVHPYQWQIDLIEINGKMVGTVQFHACPEGGYVVYLVNELSRDKNLLELIGVKKDGRGPLNYNTDVNETEIFILDVEAKTIEPNLAAQE
jgi:hypothetical protein